jgi:hypothetical protein
MAGPAAVAAHTRSPFVPPSLLGEKVRRASEVRRERERQRERLRLREEASRAQAQSESWGGVQERERGGGKGVDGLVGEGGSAREMGGGGGEGGREREMGASTREMQVEGDAGWLVCERRGAGLQGDLAFGRPVRVSSEGVGEESRGWRAVDGEADTEWVTQVNTCDLRPHSSYTRSLRPQSSYASSLRPHTSCTSSLRLHALGSLRMRSGWRMTQVKRPAANATSA